MYLTSNTKGAARWLGFTLLIAASCYLWVLPLLRPRGDFLWGYYRVKDIYLGVPVALTLLGTIGVHASTSKYRRQVVLRLVSVLVSVIVTVLAVDVVYALIVRGALYPNFWLDQAHVPRTHNVADDELGFVRKPGVSWRGYIKEANRLVDYRTDQNGFRNSPSEHLVADVVFIGDSYTEASQVNEGDTFVRRVADATGLSVVNLGRGGYGPQQELIVLQRYGLSYKPRFVVWQLFEGNDLVDANHFAAWKNAPHRSNSTLADRYFAHSFVTRLLNKTCVADRNIRWITFHYSDGNATRIPLHYLYQPSQPSSMLVGMEETSRALGLGHRLCDSQGIHLLVLFIPTMIRVMEPYVTLERKEDEIRYLPKHAGNDKNDFASRVAALCGEVGCTFVDSFAALRDAAATENRNMYIPRDEHLDVRGHEVIAQLVSDWIRKNKINQRATN